MLTMHICIYICICICVYIQIHTHIYTYTYAYAAVIVCSTLQETGIPFALYRVLLRSLASFRIHRPQYEGNNSREYGQMNSINPTGPDNITTAKQRSIKPCACHMGCHILKVYSYNLRNIVGMDSPTAYKRFLYFKDPLLLTWYNFNPRMDE